MGRRYAWYATRRFNSPFGILFVRTYPAIDFWEIVNGFNSPFGILFVRTL